MVTVKGEKLLHIVTDECSHFPPLKEPNSRRLAIMSGCSWDIFLGELSIRSASMETQDLEKRNSGLKKHLPAYKFLLVLIYVTQGFGTLMRAIIHKSRQW
ncbi:hypothetical protein ILYODFUR_015707 [Ilyodon furcidens]|uniref:Uncharacterized protein n=1 Tax=Ilyodon furcidens TaxID=33524 RepID=A0ABV0T8D4_9TELE